MVWEDISDSFLIFLYIRIAPNNTQLLEFEFKQFMFIKMNVVHDINFGPINVIKN